MAGISWERIPPPAGLKGARYELVVVDLVYQVRVEYPTGVWVVHCGHPTALWPYYGILPWTDRILVSPSGRGFRHLQDAKDAALEAWRSRPAGYGILVPPA